MSVLSNYFDKVYCVNLNRRPDRWEKVCKEFERIGIDEVERYEAIDGKEFDWTTIKYNPNLLVGELGLIETHINLIKEAKEKNYKSVLIFEDDVYFTSEFDKLDEYMAALPTNWDMIYLGGNHSYGPIPLNVNDKILKLTKTFTTHCIAIKDTLYDTIIAMTEGRKKQIDVYYADLQNIYNVYGFTPNMALQTIDYSDIQNKHVNYNHFFNG
jgi:GR25 family glycosyltransferase involved in LPS biosynthesis